MSNGTRDAFGSPMCKLKYNRMGYKRYLAPARTHTYIHIQHQNVASLLTFDFSYGGAESIDTVICQALNRQRRGGMVGRNGATTALKWNGIGIFPPYQKVHAAVLRSIYGFRFCYTKQEHTHDSIGLANNKGTP